MSRPRVTLAGLATAVVVLCHAGPATAAFPPRFALHPQPAAPAAASVCVLYFDNNTGDASYEPLKKGLADMMVTDLAAVDGLVVVERSRLEDVVGELSLQRSSLFDAATAQRVGKLVGARYAVTGAIAAVAPKIRIDVRLIEVETGKVTLADKVVGTPDDFFGLQELLSRVFVAGLGRTLAVPSASPVKDLETLLRFGEALELSDQGDDKAASKKLGEVVAADPGFTLAKTRYTELLQRVYAAREKRAAGLAEAEEALLAKADAELDGKDPKGLKPAALKRYLGYRVLRGHLFLALIARATGSDSPFNPVAIPADREGDVKGWMIAFWDNQLALAKALEAVRNKIPSFPEADDQDVKRASELGLGMNPHRLAFMSPQTVYRGLASFTIVGKGDLMASVHVAVRPSLAKLDARYADRALALLDAALADIAAHERNFRERETIRTLDLYGDALVALGRPVEAIARWQRALDDYPTSGEFGDLETKIRATLAKVK